MEQLKRCAEGYTVGKYRITGDHYFFLNFYHMQTVNKSSAKHVRGRIQSFPMFAVKQYEFFHYVELCEYTGHDVVMLKARALNIILKPLAVMLMLNPAISVNTEM